jgi:probable addiction module antidote protein
MAHHLAKKLHSIESSLNAALRTADVETIFVAFGAAIHRQKSIKELALNAGLNRITLHRMFRPKKNPSLDSVVKVLPGLGFSIRRGICVSTEEQTEPFCFSEIRL